MGPKATTRQRSTLSSFGKGGTKAAQQALAASNAKGKAKSSATLSRSSSATDLKQQDKPTYTKEQLAESEGKDDLDPNDPAFDGLWDDVMKKMGMPKLKPIHSEGMNRIDHILRVFDLDPAYGPCLGLTRLERWHRAEKLGDEPPVEIKHILETKQGTLDLKYSVLADKGV